MDFGFYDAIGLIGVCFALYSYGRVQWQRNYVRHLSYSAFNFLASVFLIMSLLHKWNLSSFVINVVWGIISIYGIYRCLKYVRKGQPAEP